MVSIPANPFSAKKEIRRGKISEKGKGGGWWGAYGLARTGGAAQITFFAGNGFGFRRKIAPNRHNFGNYRPLGRFFLWRRAAPASGFSGGR